MSTKLTSAQQTALKNHINANTTVINIASVPTQIKDVPNTPDNNADVRDWYNLAASPAFTVWRRVVPLAEIGRKLNGTELAGLSSLNHTRLQTVITLTDAMDGADPSLADQRAFWDDIFSGAGGPG